MEDILKRIENHADDPDVAAYCGDMLDVAADEILASRDRIKELESKLNNHRQFISWLTVEGTEYGEEWEELAKSGLVVEVKPTPEFIDEWGDESEMYVLAWKAHEFDPVEVP